MHMLPRPVPALVSQLPDEHVELHGECSELLLHLRQLLLQGRLLGPLRLEHSRQATHLSARARL